MVSTRSGEKSKVDSWTIAFLLPATSSSFGYNRAVTSAFLQAAFESQAPQLTLPVKGGNGLLRPPAGPRRPSRRAEEQEKEVRASQRPKSGVALPDPGAPRSPNFDGVSKDSRRVELEVAWALRWESRVRAESGLHLRAASPGASRVALSAAHGAETGPVLPVSAGVGDTPHSSSALGTRANILDAPHKHSLSADFLS